MSLAHSWSVQKEIKVQSTVSISKTRIRIRKVLWFDNSPFETLIMLNMNPIRTVAKAINEVLYATEDLTMILRPSFLVAAQKSASISSSVFLFIIVPFLFLFFRELISLRDNHRGGGGFSYVF